MLKLINANSETLELVPNENKTREISKKSVERKSCVFSPVVIMYLISVPKNIYERTVNADPETLENVPDQFRTREMCEKVIDRKMYFFSKCNR